MLSETDASFYFYRMTKQSLPLEHNYKAPANATAQSPAIIMLHGYGSDENDLFSFASELPDNYHIISLKAPNAMQPYGNAWYAIHFDADDGKFNDTEQAIASRELVVQCIEEAIKAYKLSEENITLLGFSQGTILSFAVALSYPGKIKNVIGLSGYVAEDMLTEDYKNKNHSSLNIYSSHGSVDQVIPVAWARKTKPFLENLGASCAYSEFPVGHAVAPQNFYELKAWLLSQD
jgi:phospholipase/carboxylesterase